VALVVEDGTGIADAQTYNDEAALVAYALARGLTLAAPAAALLLLKAADRMAGLDYLGDRATRDQALDFPRNGVCIDGHSYDADELPAALKQAELAFAFAANSVELMPAAATDGQGQIIEETVGPITTKWAAGAAKGATVASVPAAEQHLAKLLRRVSSTIAVSRA
jgi:hypothetical protein